MSSLPDQSIGELTMPVPTVIGSLSTIAASNSPSGSESPATTDDYFRAYAAFIASLRDTKEATLTAGTIDQYLRGDKTFQDLPTAIRAGALTGLSTASTADVVAADTVLAGIGKLQAKSALAVVRDTVTGAARLPAGTTAQRPVGVTGDLRYNTTTAKWEGFNGTIWESVDAVPVFSKEWISAELTITPAGALTVAHTLGVVPKSLEGFLICQIAQGGYIAGDILPAITTHDGETGSWGPGIVLTSTDIKIRYGANGGGFLITVFNTGALLNITAANWRYQLRAFA
jgi:hypothetical protein